MFVDEFKKILAYGVLVVFIWTSLWSVLGAEVLPPNGQLFSFMVLFLLITVVYYLLKLIKIPKLFVMLAIGFVLTNWTSLTFNKQISSTLRNVALSTILLRAGLGLDTGVSLVQMFFQTKSN